MGLSIWNWLWIFIRTSMDDESSKQVEISQPKSYKYVLVICFISLTHVQIVDEQVTFFFYTYIFWWIVVF
jgi:hypothetical protein